MKKRYILLEKQDPALNTETDYMSVVFKDANCLDDAIKYFRDNFHIRHNQFVAVVVANTISEFIKIDD
jgi:hypothetical protein